MRRRNLAIPLGAFFAVRTVGVARQIGGFGVKHVDHGAVSLATQTFGSPSDPALVLIMGATASMLGWPDDFCSALAGSGLFVIRFDHRDTGQSTTVAPGAATYAVEDLAADTLAILDAYGLDQAHLLGMSLGGYIGQMIALDHPDRVRSLTLLASEPLGWDEEPLPHIAPAFLRHFADLETLDWNDKDAVTDFLLTSERLSAGSSERFDETATRARIARILDRTDSPASMFNHATIGLRRDWAGRFRDISIPVLILHGKEDPILPVQNGEAIAGGIDGDRFVALPATGHEIAPDRIVAIAKMIAFFATGGRQASDTDIPDGR